MGVVSKMSAVPGRRVVIGLPKEPHRNLIYYRSLLCKMHLNFLRYLLSCQACLVVVKTAVHAKTGRTSRLATLTDPRADLRVEVSQGLAASRKIKLPKIVMTPVVHEHAPLMRQLIL